MNLRPILEKLYPAGKVGPGTGDLKGQCIPFMQALVKFPAPTGDLLKDKINFLKSYGFTIDFFTFGKDFQVGDVVFTSESAKYGHGAFITSLGVDDFEVAESNFSSKLRISYGRRIKKNDPKIIGVGRFPLRFDVGFKFPLRLRVCVLLNNYDKKWDFKAFTEISQWYKTVSGGKVEVDIFPVYTNLKNWWYQMIDAGGVWTETIDRGWFKENAGGLAFSNENRIPHILVMAIPNREWQGKTFNFENLRLNGGYYGRTKNPGWIIVVSDENEKSNIYPGKQSFQAVLEHEISHWFYYMGQAQYFDFTHTLDSMGKIQDMFNDPFLDYTKIFINLENY